MCLNPEKASTITLATLVLHNMLCQISHESYSPEGFIDTENENGDVVNGEWRDENIGAKILDGLPKSDTEFLVI